MGVVEGSHMSASSPRSDVSTKGKAEAPDVSTTDKTATTASFQISEVPIEGNMDAAEVTVADGTATPGSVQTSEGSFMEKADAADTTCYLKGWRLYFLSLRLAVCASSSGDGQTHRDCSVALLFFLVNIEVSIVGTSLISITDDLHGFKQGGWVVTGYLITYTSQTFHRYAV